MLLLKLISIEEHCLLAEQVGKKLWPPCFFFRALIIQVTMGKGERSLRQQVFESSFSKRDKIYDNCKVFELVNLVLTRVRSGTVFSRTLLFTRAK